MPQRENPTSFKSGSVKSEDSVPRAERLSKLLTHLENLDYATTISDIADAVGMHFNTVRDEIEYIHLCQNDIRKIKFTKTKKSKLISVEDANEKK